MRANLDIKSSKTISICCDGQMYGKLTECFLFLQWAVTFAECSAFSNVLTVSHKFRYCGHRFHLNDQACHTVLPLLLTSSHHNALLTPPSAPGSLEGEQPPTIPLPKGHHRYGHGDGTKDKERLKRIIISIIEFR